MICYKCNLEMFKDMNMMAINKEVTVYRCNCGNMAFIGLLKDIDKLLDDGDSWLDGVCKDCGSLVIEKDVGIHFKNMCSNSNCKNHFWHFVDIYNGVHRFNYYVHDPKVNKRVTIREKE